MSQKEVASATINFHFDPLCPLAWRTALWVREVHRVRPLTIQWRLFSLEVVNRAAGIEPDYINGNGWAALRTLALARSRSGNEGVERLYVALGNAQHGRKQSIGERATVRACAQEAGFAANFVQEALADENTIKAVLADHQEAVERYHAFGVPTIAFEGSHVGFYGPILYTVPQGEEAGVWWDHTSWLLQQGNLFEIKRDRAAEAVWGPVSA